MRMKINNLDENLVEFNRGKRINEKRKKTYIRCFVWNKHNKYLSVKNAAKLY